MSVTLFVIKPDAVERRLIGKIIKYIEKYGFKIEDMKMMKPDKELWKEHYEEFFGKKVLFFDPYSIFVHFACARQTKGRKQDSI